MNLVFKILMYGTIFIIGVMLFRVFRGPSVFDRLNGMFVIGLDVIVVLLLVGYTDGRQDMYIDIAISYGVLGFITSVIVAKFIGGKGSHDD
ncbi:putative monovalent cation/H+ antiporter subunit F [uncultured Eubacterium sp.]|uniref:monovalent cation/H+ antiporter complex subunit F n=1 Tax=Emergencia sp. TaxID=1926557 RepID=UPI0008205FBB|nr:putative monovalent cation/H+ antiporter subunit F [uncultured Eubacterium sp.]